MTPAERQRARRLRNRLGIVKVAIEVKPEARAALIEAGRLGAWNEDDKTAVQQALQQLMDELESDLH